MDISLLSAKFLAGTLSAPGGGDKMVSAVLTIIHHEQRGIIGEN
jgi:hypothetical protein